MRSKTFLVLTITVLTTSTLLLYGCSDDTSNKYSIDQGAIKEIVARPTPNSNFGIGDIESSLRLNLLLDESSYSSTIRHGEELTKMEWVARASVDVARPYPEKLNLLLLSRNITNFPGHSFRVTIDLYNGNNIIDSYKYISGANAVADAKSHIVDVLPLLTIEPGKSILLHARAEIEFFANIDESSISETSPAPSNVIHTTKMGNPLRLTFMP